MSTIPLREIRRRGNVRELYFTTVESMKILSGNSNRPLAEAVSQHLGMPLMKATLTRFADQEVLAEIHEDVKGEDVFVIQSTSNPTNDHLMELLVVVDALKREAAGHITAVIPYFGYSRQDRKSGPGSPISAKLVADLLTVAGVNHVITFALHSRQIQGFFDIPIDNLCTSAIFCQDITEHYDPKSLVIVSPDVGGVVRASTITERLRADMAIIDKRRKQAGVSEAVHLIGNVKDKHCILIDDIVDSAGTLCNAAVMLMEAGAKSVDAYVTHGVLSGDAIQRIEASPLKTLTISDTIQHQMTSRSIRVLTVASLLAEVIYPGKHHKTTIASLA